MTWDGLLAIGLNVVLPFLMALAGGILAARTLGPGKSREQWAWIGLFASLALVAIALAFVQQVRLTSQQATADKTNAEIQAKATGDTKYMQGELDAIQKVMVEIAKNSSPSAISPLLKGLLGSRLQAPQTFPSQPNGPNNAQLADSAKDIARRFRSLQDDLNWHEKNEREAHANGANGPIPPGFYATQIQRIQPIRTEAIALQRQILNRLPPQPENSTVNMVLRDGMISGFNPLYDVANYFDQLAAEVVLR